jgi:hypothetical protein
MQKKVQNKDWKLYEETILQHFQEVFPDYKVEGNQKIVGINSKRSRQIDVLISGEIAGFPINIVIDCKHFSTKIDVKIVESFIGMLADIKASKGVIITNIGYTKAAIERAKFDSRDIQLDIVDFEDLPHFSGTADVFPSKWNEEESLAVMFSCPFGWQNHEVPQKGIPSGLTKINVSWKAGWESRECIYMNLLSKKEFPTLKDIFDFHQSETLKNYEGAKFAYFEEVEEWFQNDFCEKLVLRLGYYKQYPETEATVFLDFGTFYAYFVLTTPVKNRDQNMRKLAFIARNTIPYDLPSKTDLLPFEYMKFHFVPNLFQDHSKNKINEND